MCCARSGPTLRSIRSGGAPAQTREIAALKPLAPAGEVFATSELKTTTSHMNKQP